jgi:hypothetical protein
LISIFFPAENGIDQEAFDVMDEATLKEILPEKSQTGLRLKFWNKYNKHVSIYYRV